MTLLNAARAARTQVEGQLQARMAEPTTVAAAKASFAALDAFVASRFTAEHFATPGSPQLIALRVGHDPATNKPWDAAVAAAVAGMFNALTPEAGGGYAKVMTYYRERIMGDPGQHATYLVVAESAEAAKVIPTVKDASDLYDPWPFQSSRSHFDDR